MWGACLDTSPRPQVSSAPLVRTQCQSTKPWGSHVPRIALAVSLTLAAALLAGSTTALAAESAAARSRRRCSTARSPPRPARTRPPATAPTGRTAPASRPAPSTSRARARSRSSSRATEGDWDVAVFDATGRALAADASPDAQEVAIGYTAGGRLDVQACRRSGNAAAVPASLEFAALRPARSSEAKANPPQLVSVITPTQAQKDQLLALGLDMTEHGGKETPRRRAPRQAGRGGAAQGRLPLARARHRPRRPEPRAARRRRALRRPRRPLRPSRAAATPTARSPTTTRSSRRSPPRTPTSSG